MMRGIRTDVLVIGGGAGGMAAALSAAREKSDVILLERESSTGGVLNQCIHNGFGLHFYKEELTGPEFADKLFNEMTLDRVNIISESYVREVDVENKTVRVLSPDGAYEIYAKAIVIATGARERPFGALMIPGDRPSGIYTAGLAQRFVNLENRLPGKKALILGSGDIGLIMARRLVLEGMKVEAVVERMPFPGGLLRNIVQCLEDYNIPLYLSHTVTKTVGRGRLEKVEVSEVDKNYNPIPGTEKIYDVDTLILSAGLIPQVEDISDSLQLDKVNKGYAVSNSCETNIDGIYAAGNNVAVFDLVDYVAAEGWVAGRHAALKSKGGENNTEKYPVIRGKNVSILVPSYIDFNESLRLYLRISKPIERGRVILKELDIEKKFVDGVPSEMIQMVLNKKKMELIREKGSLSVEVLEDE